jgi:hypothetical protein
VITSVSRGLHARKKKGWEEYYAVHHTIAELSGLCRQAIDLSCRYLLWYLPSGRGLT